MQLPLLLAGPILRRTTKDEVVVWIATSKSPGPQAKGSVFGSVTGLNASPAQLGTRTNVESIQLGDSLLVSLLRIEPTKGTFPVDAVLEYDLDLALTPPSRTLQTLASKNAFTLKGFSRPSFVIQGRVPLVLLHGSCRKLHGENADASTQWLRMLNDSAQNIGNRPHALIFAGDQIYADEVSGAMLQSSMVLSRELLGYDEHVPLGSPIMQTLPLSTFPPVVRGYTPSPSRGTRQELVESCGFTTGWASRQLVGLGEYAAMYLAAWNPDLMPSDARIDDWIRSLGHRGFLPSYWNGYDTEVTQSKHLKLARVGGESLRAVMANVPCYMLFDDHEVTDDWNLDGTWHRKVFRSPVGKRIVSNALLAYWAFQGWGNDPDAFAPNWVQELRDYAALQSARRGTATTAQAQRYEELLWNHEGWGFVAPTTPPCILVDTRTQRDFNLGKWRAPRLLNAQALKEFKRQVRQVVRDPSAPLVLVLPCPFIGHLLSDQYRQTRLLRNRGTSGVDYELWRDNGRGWLDLLDALVELGLERVIVLSGDVHFGCQVMSSIARRKGKVIHNLKVLELTSSAIKNENVNTRTNIAYLQRKYHRSRVGAAIVDIHDLITGPNASRYPDPLDSDFDRGKIEGWERPSGLAFKRGTNAGDRLIQDAIFQGYGGANAYMAREVVLLGEGLAGYLGVPDPPDWIEDVKYPGPAAVVGTNNVGWLRILSGEVHHVLKTRSGSGYLVEERW